VRILYLNHNVAGSGTYQRAFNLGRQLVGRGHAVTLVTTSRSRRRGSDEQDVHGVRVMETPDLLLAGARNGWDPWNAGWRIRRLQREQFDLIHAFDCRPVVIGPALAQVRRSGAPLFLDWADWWGRGGTISERSGWLVRTVFGPVETWFEEAFRIRAVGNTTISEPLRSRCIALGVDAQRVVALPNGCVPPERVSGGRAAARARRGLGDEPVVVHLGVAHAGDAEMLFAAFRHVVALAPTAKLVLVGNFRGMVPADLARHVRRTGFVEEEVMRDWLAAADVAVIPMRATVAHHARWPGKVNEYLSAGVPVVLPAVGSAAAWIENAGAGRVCAPAAEALGAALLETLHTTEQEKRRMSDAARRLAAGPLSWERVTDRLVDFYTAWSPMKRGDGRRTAAGAT
jgi:glycosyltransferase involved in cell wall biosynthesis